MGCSYDTTKQLVLLDSNTLKIKNIGHKKCSLLSKSKHYWVLKIRFEFRSQYATILLFSTFVSFPTSKNIWTKIRGSENCSTQLIPWRTLRNDIKFMDTITHQNSAARTLASSFLIHSGDESSCVVPQALKLHSLY